MEMIGILMFAVCGLALLAVFFFVFGGVVFVEKGRKTYLGIVWVAGIALLWWGGSWYDQTGLETLASVVGEALVGGVICATALWWCDLRLARPSR